MFPSVSVVLTTYRRLANLDRIIKAWLAEGCEVWLADSSGGKFKTDLPINHVQFAPDPGNKTMHAVGPLTTGDFVIYGDDDLLPHPGLVADMHAGWEAAGGGVVGLIGRVFTGDEYYKTRWLGAKKVQAPTPVDFCSYAFTPRHYLGFDLRGCESPVEDLFWHMKVFPGIRKSVVPTRKYEALPESHDDGCLFHDEKARAVRQAFYKEWYHRNAEHWILNQQAPQVLCSAWDTLPVEAMA